MSLDQPVHELADLPRAAPSGSMASISSIPLPSDNPHLRFRRADFDTVAEALDYAAQGDTGVQFYDSRGRLSAVLSYHDLREAAVETAKRLIALGLERGDRVAMLAATGPEFLIDFFACQYAGTLAVPLPVPSSLGSRGDHIGHLRRLLITSGSRVALGPDEFADDLAAAGRDLDLLHCGPHSALETKPLCDGALRTLGAEEDSHIQYSSGSTRTPAGVVITQKALMANAVSIARDGLEISETDRCVSWLPYYHDMGLIGFVLVPMMCQRSIDYLAPDSFARRPLEWLKLIARNRGTISFSPSFGYEICVRRAGRQSEMLDLSCWRVAGIGGEMVQPRKMQNFCETFAPHGFRPEALVPSYGLAEATLAVSFAPLNTGVETDRVDREKLSGGFDAVPSDSHDEIAAKSFVRCGKPMPGYAVEIRDEDGKVLNDRQIGTVFLKAPSLFTGYFNDDEATAQVLTEDGWLNTGDRGYAIDGELVITGRSKDLLIVNGRNIWPQDLEAAAEEVDEVKPRDSAAFAISDADGGEQAVLLIQCRISEDQARRRVRSEVQAAARRRAGIDCSVVLIPPGSLPFTTSGKLSRSKARQNYLAGLYTIADAA